MAGLRAAAAEVEPFYDDDYILPVAEIRPLEPWRQEMYQWLKDLGLETKAEAYRICRRYAHWVRCKSETYCHKFHSPITCKLKFCEYCSISNKNRYLRKLIPLLRKIPAVAKFALRSITFTIKKPAGIDPELVKWFNLQVKTCLQYFFNYQVFRDENNQLYLGKKRLGDYYDGLRYLFAFAEAERILLRKSLDRLIKQMWNGTITRQPDGLWKKSKRFEEAWSELAGIPTQKMLELFNRIQKYRRNHDREKELRKKFCGAIWIDEVGWNNSNLHAHALVFSPFIPIEDLYEVWMRLTGSWSCWIEPRPGTAVTELHHMLGYVAKMPSDDPEQLARLEKAFDGKKVVYRIGLFYKMKVEGSDQKRVCPACRADLVWEVQNVEWMERFWAGGIPSIDDYKPKFAKVG